MKTCGSAWKTSAAAAAAAHYYYTPAALVSNLDIYRTPPRKAWAISHGEFYYMLCLLELD